MSRSIFTRASSARSRASSICSALTGLSPAPCSSPFSDALIQLPSVAFGMPNTRAVTDASCPPLTSLTASSLNSSVYFALLRLSSCLLISRAPSLQFHHQLWSTFFRGKARLPMKAGRAGTVTHDYKRHGTTTLFAALNTLDGRVISMC